VIERTFAWFGRNRRLAKDFEATIASGCYCDRAGARKRDRETNPWKDQHHRPVRQAGP